MTTSILTVRDATQIISLAGTYSEMTQAVAYAETAVRINQSKATPDPDMSTLADRVLKACREKQGLAAAALTGFVGGLLAPDTSAEDTISALTEFDMV